MKRPSNPKLLLYGVYRIAVPDGREFISGSVEWQREYGWHLKQCLAGESKNKVLQDAINDCGIGSLQVELLACPLGRDQVVHLEKQLTKERRPILNSIQKGAWKNVKARAARQAAIARMKKELEAV